MNLVPLKAELQFRAVFSNSFKSVMVVSESLMVFYLIYDIWLLDVCSLTLQFSVLECLKDIKAVN